MSEHTIKLAWQRNSPDFNYESYSRNHTITYGAGSTICASSAPEFFGDPLCIDPEQSFVMALASCHMLTFLALASRKGFTVDKYVDEALGVLGKNKAGRTAMIKVHLKPSVVFSGNKIPTEEDFHSLHDRAHRGCIIANSISNCVEVIINPVMAQKQTESCVVLQPKITHPMQ